MGAIRTAAVVAAALVHLACDRTYLISTSGGRDAGTLRLDASIDAAAEGADARPAMSGCRAPSECDDGVFCNGAERCGDPLPGTSELRCLGGRPPCAPDERCIESGARCEPICPTPDADADGHASPECGGDDCDDHDATRAPGLAEVCMPGDHDEDCNPLTVGVRDEDGDGHVSRLCCNVRASGALACGSDCDDGDASVHVRASERCDGEDDDCDGRVDEGVMVPLFLDRDRDGYGGRMAAIGCPEAGLTPASGDCDDDDATRSPGAAESCDGEDDDCDGRTDEAVAPPCP